MPTDGLPRSLPPRPPATTRADRRQVSVLFCDVVGSTALAHRLDPEDLAVLMNRYHQAAAAVVGRLGGHVAQLLGDGVMAYFGWPVGREDDAERAVAAGLSLVESLPQLVTLDDRPLAVRVGIATGLVVIGGGAATGDGRATGPTPNVAARLQAEAAPNTLVVAPLTARLAGRSFRYRSLGLRSMHGLPKPLEVFQVTGRRSALGRFEAAQVSPPGPLVGRQSELDDLMAGWAQATRGIGQILHLSGEAGIGKSRLVHAVRERIEPTATVLRFQGSSLHQSTMLFPVLQPLMRSIGMTGRQSAAETLARLLEWCQPIGGDAADLASRLGRLLGIDLPGRLPEEPAEQTGTRLVALLSRRVLEMARDTPVLAIVEDAQWLDPTSRNLLVDLASRIDRTRMAILVTSRDALAQGAPLKGYAGEHRLTGLSDVESRRLVEAVADGRLSPPVCSEIVARAGGIPLYLEELTLALIDEGRSGRIGEIPPSLQALLAARLDRLGDAKPLLQVGAVLGRQFAMSDLQAIVGRSASELWPILATAVAAGLVMETLSSDDRALTFKHALVQEAAYAGLLNREKRRLHAAVLSHLEASDWSAIAGAAVVMASHAERAESWDKAGRYLVEALTQAVRSRAYGEALALYERAMHALLQVPGDVARPLALQAHLLALNPLLAAADLDRALEIAREATALARGLGDLRPYAIAEGRHAGILWLTGHNQEGLNAAALALGLADKLEDRDLQFAARFTQANLLHATGRLAEASLLYGRLIEVLPEPPDLRRAGWMGIPTVMVRAFRTWTLLDLGEFRAARQMMVEATEQVRGVRDGYSVACALMAEGLYRAATSRPGDAIESLERACRMLHEVGVTLPLASAFLATAYVEGGRAVEALALLSAIGASQAQRLDRLRLWAAYHHLALARALIATGAPAPARAAIRRAQEIARDTQAPAVLAESLHTEAALAAQDPTSSPNDICAIFGRAVDLGQLCGMRPLVARCLAGMARARETAGDAAAAADYDRQARLVLAELDMPSG